MTTKQKILDLVQTLMDARPFRADFVARATNAKFQRVVEESNDYFSVFRGTSIGDGLQSVEVRLPTAKAAAKNGLVLLDVLTDHCVSKSDVMTRFGTSPELSVPTPRQPPESPLYFVYRLDWGVLRFGFERAGRECLTKVVLDGTESPSGR